MKLRNQIAIALVVTFLFACKSSKNSTTSSSAFSGQKMPETFATNNDTINSAKLNWKELFVDSNLQALIEIGLQNNFDLQVALQRMEVANASVLQSKGALFPTLNSSFSFWQRKFGYYTMDDAGNRVTEIEPGKLIPTNLPDYFVGLQTSWEVDVWGKLKNKKKAAVARYLASLQGKNLVVTNLISSVAHNYYELLALDAELEIIKETIKLEENALELVSTQKQVGVANELAVQQFQAQLLNTKSLEFELQQQIYECESKINFILGRYPEKIVRDKSRLFKSIPSKIKTGIPSNLLQNRPDIKQAEFELIAAKADLNAAKAAFYPSLTINGTLGFQGYKAALLFTNPQSIAYSLLGNLITPLVNRSAIKAAFKSANAFQVEALCSYQKATLNAYVEVYNQVAKLKSVDKAIALKTEETNAMSKSIETANDLFKYGKASYLEILLTQKGALETKIQLIEYKKRQFICAVDLYKALGGGWQ